jgi:nicotinate-nucleotide pyrophosphorylase (carboxylating)
MDLNDHELKTAIERFLAEDVGRGDLTTTTLIEPTRDARAQLLLEEPGIVCGLKPAALVFAQLDLAVTFLPTVGDGTRLSSAPATVADISGPARAILSGERTAINLVGHLSGIATLTHQFVDLVAGTGVRILDTRKTTPGLRALEKYAVRCGGGSNHRMGLDDAILIKENHLRLAGGIRAAIEQFSTNCSRLPVEVEAETLGQVAESVDAGADRILLDNMTAAEVQKAVELAAGRVELEASGGITLKNVQAYAATGVDSISIGALTHSARSLNLSLELQ